MSQADMERRAFHIEGAAGSKAQRQGIEWHKFEHCQVLQYDWNVECKEGRWYEMTLEEEPGGCKDGIVSGEWRDQIWGLRKLL